VTRFGETAALEIVSTAAYYSFVSLILNANRTPLPEGATPLPALSEGRKG